MSVLDAATDAALAHAPWVPSSAGPSRWLTKHAPLPDREGYAFLATDLSAVLFEALPASAIPTRQASVDLACRRAPADPDDSGGREAAERTLARLAEAMRGPFDLESRRDSYFDMIFTLKTGDFVWMFNTTELRGRQPVELLARHLVVPLCGLVASSRGLREGGGTDGVAAVLEDAGVRQALVQAAGATPTGSPKQPSNDDHPAGRTRRAHVRAERDEAAAKQDATDEAEAEEEPYDESAYADYTSTARPTPTAADSPSPAHRRAHNRQSSATSSAPARSSPPPSTPPAPSPPGSEPDADADAPGRAASPSPPPAPRKKGKREADADEDAEMERRRREMKERAARGAGGRLARRKR